MNTHSKKTIRRALTNEHKPKQALSSLEGALQTLNVGLRFTTDQVAEAIKNNPDLMRNMTVSLVNSLAFRKKISKEILAYLLEKEEKGITQVTAP